MLTLTQQDLCEDLRGQQWIASSSASEMGVWPGLDERPVVVHIARDWLAKLNLVAAGAGITTVPTVSPRPCPRV